MRVHLDVGGFTIIFSYSGPNDDFDVSVQSEGMVSIMWDPPSNIDSFILQNYRLMINCQGTVISMVTKETAYRHEGELNLGSCIATVEVINSCGATSNNSRSFIHTRG